MKRLWLIALFAVTTATADVRLGVDIEVVNPDKICAKAIAVLRAGLPLTDAEARAFLSVDGKVLPAKCLETIFSDLSSPTNGFRVHQVTSRVETAEVGIDAAAVAPK